MKTEKEIREYRDSLLKLTSHDCDCKGCLVRASMAISLTWALGEADSMQDSVDKINEDAAMEL